jgi:hypothetical protein
MGLVVVAASRKRGTTFSQNSYVQELRKKSIDLLNQSSVLNNPKTQRLLSKYIQTGNAGNVDVPNKKIVQSGANTQTITLDNQGNVVNTPPIALPANTQYEHVETFGQGEMVEVKKADGSKEFAFIVKNADDIIRRIIANCELPDNTATKDKLKVFVQQNKGAAEFTKDEFGKAMKALGDDTRKMRLLEQLRETTGDVNKIGGKLNTEGTTFSHKTIEAWDIADKSTNPSYKSNTFDAGMLERIEKFKLSQRLPTFNRRTYFLNNPDYDFEVIHNGFTIRYDKNGFPDFIECNAAADKKYFVEITDMGVSSTRKPEYMSANNTLTGPPLNLQKDVNLRYGENGSPIEILENGGWTEYIWHHHQDGKTMMPVKTLAHDKLPHSGGFTIADPNKTNFKGLFSSPN